MNSRFYLHILITTFLLISVPAFLLAAPGNDLCSNATTLTPNTTCSTIRGDLYLASNESISTSTCGTTNDVWYKFTVPSNAISTIISVSMDNGNTATNANTYIEVFTASLCSSISTLTTLGCSGTASSLTLSLTAGSTYYFRVFTTVSTGGNSVKYGFDICVSYTAPPSNDDCSGAVILTPAVSCSNTIGTLNNTTATTGLPAGCESGGTHYDAWYKFTAGSTYELIFLSGPGTNFTNPEIQLYSGTCGSLTSLQCGTTLITATGLTVSTIYYVRVSNVGSAITTNGGFSICVYHPAASSYDYSKSYVNITRNSGGGTINPGDTLEIRGTLAIQNIGTSTLDSLAFFDTLYHNSGLRYVPGSLALRTNEGKIYKAFTDAANDDAGYQYANGLDTVMRMNIGAGASASARGRLTGISKPKVYTSACIIMATYRVVVYAGYNSNINLGGGTFTMKDANTGISGNLSLSSRNAVVYNSPGLCPNAVSATNAIGGDFNGTFGTPAVSAPLIRNRGTSSNVPGYIYKPFTSTGGPNDYYYAIANNTSQAFTTATTWPKPTTSPAYRLFNVWDVTGDHTGATNTAKGNPPCDTTLPRSTTNPCGYMLLINSAYKTDTAFQYSVTNLCPNTYYEISAWIKNICYKCSCDSNGVGASGAGYIPFATNDSSGVQPNLAFDINGTDYFTTGNITYAGIYPTTQAGSDSTNKWVKRGFTYLTGLSQSSLTLSIRNNAPGGGGNDWALDDISLATCLPNMNYSPSLNPPVCDSNTLTINDTVRSYFNNYANYMWQRSTNHGTTWTDISGTQGTATPTWNGSAYQYVSSYAVPPSRTNLSDSGDLYRVIVATTSPNLSNSNCQLTDGVSIITLNVINCLTPLNIEMLSFNGKLITGHADLFWSTSKEDEAVHFDIEKSSDGINFTKIGTIKGYINYGSEINHYFFIDPLELSGKAWFRIIIINNKGGKKYSRIIRLADKQIVFGLSNIVNPFMNQLSFEVITSDNAKIDVSLVELFGKTVKSKSYTVYSGVNSLSIVNTQGLSPGLYILKVKNKDIVINNKVIKK